MKITIKMKQDVKLPRFTLYKGEIWYTDTNSNKHEGLDKGFLSIGNGVVNPNQYEIIKVKGMVTKCT